MPRSRPVSIPDKSMSFALNHPVLSISHPTYLHHVLSVSHPTYHTTYPLYALNSSIFMLWTNPAKWPSCPLNHPHQINSCIQSPFLTPDLHSLISILLNPHRNPTLPLMPSLPFLNILPCLCSECSASDNHLQSSSPLSQLHSVWIKQSYLYNIPRISCSLLNLCSESSKILHLQSSLIKSIHVLWIITHQIYQFMRSESSFIKSIHVLWIIHSSNLSIHALWIISH